MRIGRVLVGVLAAMLPCLSPAQQDTLKEIERYRQLLQESNPAELYEARGAEHWTRKRGPKNSSLERCDLGLGPGVVKGAYVRLPRYFADSDRVQDLESRLVACIASESRGMTIALSLSHPKEHLAYQAGEKLFYYRAGPYDFGCVTCHSEEGKRIRLQSLPKMDNAKDAQRAFGTWPAYRVSEGELRSMQWRMWECIRQMRFPELEFASDASIALITYLAKKAEGGTLDAPSLKR